MQNINFQDVFDTPTAPQSKLGAVGQTPDGRLWKYLYATEAITKYMAVARPANTDVDTVSSSANGSSQTVYITESSAGWTVGAYQDHWMIVNSGTGVGQIGKIKDNTADTLELYTDYALSTSLAVADSDILIIHENDAEKMPITNQYAHVQGVAQVTFASADYGWFLIRGLGGLTLGAAGTEYYWAIPGDDTEGYAVNMDAGDTLEENSPIGQIVAPSDTADTASLVYVNVL